MEPSLPAEGSREGNTGKEKNLTETLYVPQYYLTCSCLILFPSVASAGTRPAIPPLELKQIIKDLHDDDDDDDYDGDDADAAADDNGIIDDDEDGYIKLVILCKRCKCCARLERKTNWSNPSLSSCHCPEKIIMTKILNNFQQLNHLFVFIQIVIDRDNNQTGDATFIFL